jgi:hypothetical protein
MKAAPHPPHSPDLVPSDFCLFGYIKGCLACISFENADELLESVRRVLAGIEKVTLRVVFREWMEWLRQCIATNGEYVECSKINVSERLTFIRTLVRCPPMRETPCVLCIFGNFFGQWSPKLIRSEIMSEFRIETIQRCRNIPGCGIQIAHFLFYPFRFVRTFSMSCWMRFHILFTNSRSCVLYWVHSFFAFHFHILSPSSCTWEPWVCLFRTPNWCKSCGCMKNRSFDPFVDIPVGTL